MAIKRLQPADRRMTIAIGVLVVVWLAAMWRRNDIRAYLWSRQLVAAESLNDQATLLAKIAGLGGASLSAAGFLFEQDDPAMRAYAVGLANGQRVDRSRDLLMRATHDKDDSVREAAVFALADWNDEAMLVSIAKRDGDSAVACAAIESLAAIGTNEAIDAVIERMSRSTNLDVRVQAIESLGEIETTRAVDALIAMLNDDTIYAGTTAAERSAMRAISAVQPGVDVAMPKPRTLAQRAAEALRRIELARLQEGVDPAATAEVDSTKGGATNE